MTLNPTLSMQAWGPGSRCFDRDVFERGGIDKARDQAKRRFPHPRADAIDKCELPDRGEDRLFGDELLKFFEHRRALLVIELFGLLREELVNVGITAVNISPAFDDK